MRKITKQERKNNLTSPNPGHKITAITQQNRNPEQGKELILSTLTRILIVLLTISSIFLCGIVVTYVANADNYREKYNSQKAEFGAARESQKNIRGQLKENIAKTDRQKTKLTNEIASLKIELEKLKDNLNNAEREKANLLARVNSWASITKDFYQTTDKQRQLFENTFEQLNKLKAEQIKDHKELSDISAAMEEKMAIIAMLDEKNRRLLEEKAELENRLNQLLQPSGKVTAVPPVRLPSVPEARDITLKGLITAVDLKNSMASISIGEADGVREGMKFHVTRGDQFLCDILIIDVDAEEAVGVLDLVQQQPRVGDNVSTKL